MQEIVVEKSLRSRIEDLIGSRRDAWPVFAVIGCAALVVMFLAARSAPAKIAPPAVAPTPQISGLPSPAGILLVHVAGAVRRPGLYEVVAGGRVADAIEGAGGAVPRADLDALNLAETIADGMKIYVPRRGEPVPEATSSTHPAVDRLVPLNSADQAELETLPGIGPVTAGAILDAREAAGGFSSVEELLDIDGIGPATLDELRPHVTL